MVSGRGQPTAAQPTHANATPPPHPLTPLCPALLAAYRKSAELDLQDWIRLLDRVDGMYMAPKYEAESRLDERRRSSQVEKDIIKAIEASKQR